MGNPFQNKEFVERFVALMTGYIEDSHINAESVCDALSNALEIPISKADKLDSHEAQIADALSPQTVADIQALLDIPNEKIFQLLDPDYVETADCNDVPPGSTDEGEENPRSKQTSISPEGWPVEELARLSETLRNCTTDEERTSLVDSLIERRLAPPTTFLNNVVSSTRNAEKAENWFGALVAIGASPNDVTFNLLLRVSREEGGRSRLLEKMQEFGVSPNSHTYSTLIGGSTDYPRARHFWDMLVESDVTPNDYHVSALMARVRSFEDAVDALEAMKLTGFKLNAKNYGMAISKTRSDSQVLKLLDDMDIDGTKLNDAVIGTAMARVNTFQSALEILRRQSNTAIPVDQRSTTKLVNLADSREDFRKAIDAISNIQGGNASDTINALLSKVEDFDTGMSILSDAVERGIELNIKSFGRITSLSENTDQAMSVVELIKKAGNEPNIIIMNTVVSRSDNFDNARKLISAIIHDGITPNARTVNIALSKAPNLEVAKGYLDEILEMGIRPNIITLNTIMGKAIKLKDAEDILSLARSLKDIEIDVVTYSNMLTACERPEDVNRVFEIWLEDKLEGQLFLQKACLRYCDFVDAEDLLSWFFGAVTPRTDLFPLKQFGQAIEKYFLKGKVDSALRVAMSFPYLSQAQKAFRSHLEKAVSLFRFYFENDEKEAHNAAYALAKVYQAVDKKTEMKIWAETASKHSGLAQKRLDDISAMISA